MSEEQNDGKKTEEQLAQERLERYKQEPYKFVEMSDIIACMIRDKEQGPMIFLRGKSKPELQVAWAELNQKIMTEISRMEMVAAMNKKPKIHKPGGFFGGLRKLR